MMRRAIYEFIKSRACNVLYIYFGGAAIERVD